MNIENAKKAIRAKLDGDQEKEEYFLDRLDERGGFKVQMWIGNSDSEIIISHETKKQKDLDERMGRPWEKISLTF